MKEEEIRELLEKAEKGESPLVNDQAMAFMALYADLTKDSCKVLMSADKEGKIILKSLEAKAYSQTVKQAGHDAMAGAKEALKDYDAVEFVPPKIPYILITYKKDGSSIGVVGEGVDQMMAVEGMKHIEEAIPTLPKGEGSDGQDS